MIGRIAGILLEKQPPRLLVDVAGLGYEVEASMNTFYQLPDEGQKVVLHTHFVVREDAQLLYGFFELAERRLFRELIKVNGVGPKLALAILSNITAQEFAQCIADSNSLQLTKMPGVGKKTAERLIIEMRDRMKDWTSEIGITTTDMQINGYSQSSSPSQEALSALVALGYKNYEAAKILKSVEKPDLNSQELIRLALKELSR